jgi:tetratricopeptide (TPR) repeat protein
MKAFEQLILELKETLKEAKPGENPSLFTEKVKHVYNLVKSYRERLEGIEKKIEKYLEQQETVVRKKRGNMLRGFVQSMSISKTDILTLIDRGWNYIVSGDYKQAEKVLEKAKKKAPDNAQVLKLLGWAYMYTEKYDSALMLYQEVLKMHPDDAMARNNLGYVCYRKKIFGEAIEHLSRVIKSGKDISASLYANYYLGLIYLERSMYSDAIHFFGKALEIGPNLLEAKYHMALSYYGKGNRESARQIWQEMVKKNPDSRWSKLAKKKLEIKSQKGNK